MVHVRSNDLAQFYGAARAMMEDGLVDTDAGHFSKTVFANSDGRHPFLIETLISTTKDCEMGLVVLDFSLGSRAKRPRRYTVAAQVAGTQIVERDCALWTDTDGRAVLVPRGRGAEGHFVIGDQGYTC